MKKQESRCILLWGCPKIKKKSIIEGNAKTTKQEANTDFFFAEMNKRKFEYQQPTIRDSRRGNRITKVSLSAEITV